MVIRSDCPLPSAGQSSLGFSIAFLLGTRFIGFLEQSPGLLQPCRLSGAAISELAWRRSAPVRPQLSVPHPLVQMALLADAALMLGPQSLRKLERVGLIQYG